MKGLAKTEKSAIAYCQKRQKHSFPLNEVIHPQLPLRMPCYDLAPVTSPTLSPRTQVFGYYRLPWLDGQ